MAKAWSTWLPDVLPHVPGCPVLVAEHEIKRAAQHFFEKSRAWHALTSLLAVAQAQATVTVTLPDASTELVRIEAAWLDGKDIDPATAQDMDEAEPDWASRTGTPTRVLLLTPGIVRLFPIPMAAAVQGLKLRCSVRPSEAATGIPDDLAVQYREDITQGAKARLLIYGKKPWTDMDLGRALMASFDARAAAANVKANVRGNSNARRAPRSHWC
jgi:hypothetical protein